MTATSSKTAFAPLLTVHCRSIAATMAGYWRFWRATNVRLFRKLRSDYPLFFTCCNCLRQCRCAHSHRLLMSHRVGSSGARARTARFLGLLWHRENHALCPKHGLTSAWPQRFVSPDAGPIYLSTEPWQCPLTCISSSKLYVCRTFLVHKFSPENEQLSCRPNPALTHVMLNTDSLNPGFPGRTLPNRIAQLIARFHQLNGDSCARDGCRHHRLTSRQNGGKLCLTVEDAYASNRCSQPKSLACPSMPILPT
jgi:hypothetical protein